MTENPITRMFSWWNQAYAESSFTPEGFSRFFTDDAPFIVDGGTRGVGPVEIDAHFQRIQAATDEVELEPTVMLVDGDVGFVRYQTRFRIGDDAGYEQCIAMARFRGDKIAAIEIFQRAPA